MNKPGVLDTSTLILLGRITAIDALPDAAFITAVTMAELSVGPLVATTDEDRAARQAHLQAAEADFDPLPFDAAAARAFGGVAASLRRSGRKPAARAYAAMTALAIVGERYRVLDTSTSPQARSLRVASVGDHRAASGRR